MSGKIPEEGIGPVGELKQTLKLSRVIQLLKLEGIILVRLFCERSTSIKGMDDISGIIQVSSFSLRFDILNSLH